MKRRDRHVRTLAASGLAALAIVMALPAAQADVARTGGEPWYEQSTDSARQRARALFEQGLDKHHDFLRGDALELYEQALALWDNPDIRWNLALVLEDLGQYLRAHEQLEAMLRWGAALGAQRLRDVLDRMRELETRRLARIEASSDEPGADITLDGQAWFRGAGHQSALVKPGEHYVAARKAGAFPVTRSVSVTAGQAARVALPMDADRLIETRRWSAWKPWVVISAGVVATAVGAGLERQAIGLRSTAARSVANLDLCDSPKGCTPMASPADYDRAVTNNRIAIGAFVAGGTALAVGLTMAWINQLQVHRTEARAPGPIEITPILSTDRAGVSVRLRF